jgi:putative ABC transport system substrate-binding protein
LELLRQFIPKARTIAMLVNPNTPETEAERKEIQVAAQKMGLSLIILDVTSGGDIEAAFATLAARGVE